MVPVSHSPVEVTFILKQTFQYEGIIGAKDLSTCNSGICSCVSVIVYVYQ